MSDVLTAALAADIASLPAVSGNKEPPPPPWFHFWDQLESRIKNIDPAEPAVLCVKVRATGKAFWTSLAGVSRKNLEFTLLSTDQFERVEGKWVRIGEIDIQFRISKNMPFPTALRDGKSIEIDAENLTITIHPYRTVRLPIHSR